MFTGNLLADCLGMGPYGTIYADPPWPSGKGGGTSKISHMRTYRPYTTMTKQELFDLPVSSIAFNDSVLVLWVTWMHLKMGVELMEKWGFSYATGKPWVKTTSTGKISYGPGTWFLHCSELLLIGRKGKPFGSNGNPRPATKGLIMEPKTVHSRKPQSVRNWIHEKLPGPHIELFAREQHEG